jgi:hypothetical protein
VARQVETSQWIGALSLIILGVLGVVDLFVSESVPLIIYGILGGVALSASPEIWNVIFGGRK